MTPAAPASSARRRTHGNDDSVARYTGSGWGGAKFPRLKAGGYGSVAGYAGIEQGHPSMDLRDWPRIVRDQPRIAFDAPRIARDAAVIASDGQATEVASVFIEIGDGGIKRGVMIIDVDGAIIEVSAASIEVGGFLDTFDAVGTARGDFYIAGDDDALAEGGGNVSRDVVFADFGKFFIECIAGGIKVGVCGIEVGVGRICTTRVSGNVRHRSGKKMRGLRSAGPSGEMESPSPSGSFTTTRTGLRGSEIASP